MVTVVGQKFVLLGMLSQGLYILWTYYYDIGFSWAKWGTNFPSFRKDFGFMQIFIFYFCSHVRSISNSLENINHEYSQHLKWSRNFISTLSLFTWTEVLCISFAHYNSETPTQTSIVQSGRLGRRRARTTHHSLCAFCKRNHHSLTFHRDRPNSPPSSPSPSWI